MEELHRHQQDLEMSQQVVRKTLYLQEILQVLKDIVMQMGLGVYPYMLIRNASVFKDTHPKQMDHVHVS